MTTLSAIPGRIFQQQEMSDPSLVREDRNPLKEV